MNGYSLQLRTVLTNDLKMFFGSDFPNENGLYPSREFLGQLLVYLGVFLAAVTDKDEMLPSGCSLFQAHGKRPQPL